MSIFFSAVFLFCIAYWVIATACAGQLLADGWLWLFFAFLALLNFLAARGYRSEWRHVTLRLVATLHTASFALAAVMAAAAALVASGLHPGPAENPEYVIVLGAELRPDGALSKTLKRRLDRAIVFSDESPGTQFILSGGSAGRGGPTEARAMADYLQYNGLPSTKLILEGESRNTYENIRNSLALIRDFRAEESGGAGGARAKPSLRGNILSAESRPLKIGVLSSDFHLFRAVHMARKETDGPVHGIAAPSDPLLFLHNLCRESAALLKDKFLGRL